jgi:glucose-6-phosphate-specific signal transduction histidine kinase
MTGRQNNGVLVTLASSRTRRRNVGLDLTVADGTRALVVKDDDSGLVRDWEQKLGLGVRIMRHRASVVGASVTLEPRKSS